MTIYWRFEKTLICTCLPGLNDISVYNESGEFPPSNPFLKQKENSLLDVALQVLSTVTARKSPRKLLEKIHG